MARPVWRAEVAPAVVVMLAPATEGVVEPLQLGGFGGAARRAGEGVYICPQCGPQLLLTGGARLCDPLAVVVPLDGFAEIRLSAASQLVGRLGRDVPPDEGLPELRRRRLRLMVQAADGRAAGASYRDIAGEVLGEREPDSVAWRTSSARDVAIRLCRGAAALMHDGYLRLLKRRL